ncbi:Uncharacterised protein [Mycobacterium tuberculosis]|uniref:Uncharacterized protein n=1 Tax=Mycobacterium tuberculosis TaxID=1773 RepID=A0A0U0QWP4_MYCTX|nr:Uncharacterised protein [Mycobacterium tuberculosis]
MFISVAATGMVGPDTTRTRARFSPAVRSHHQQVDGCSRMSTTSRGLSGYAERSNRFTTGILASVEGSTVNGLVLPALPAFCRIWATNGGSVCTPSPRTNEYCCGPLICGVTITVPIGPGAPGNVAGPPAFGTSGTNSSGPTGKASNNARLIGRAWLTCSGVNPSGNNTARFVGSIRDRRPSRMTHASPP